MCETADTLASDTIYASQLNNLISRTSAIEYTGESKSRHLLHYIVDMVNEKYSELKNFHNELNFVKVFIYILSRVDSQQRCFRCPPPPQDVFGTFP